MIRMAGRICDGVKLHGFATRKYLEDIAMPAIEEGLRKSGRSRRNFDVSGGGFIATGATEEELAKQIEFIRYRVAFYGATRTYHVVFECHGWEDLGMKLHQMAKEGKWKEMAAEVPDDVVHEFAAVATHANLKGAIAERFGGLTDSLLLGLAPGGGAGARRELVQELQSIPNEFEGFSTEWN
jgi:alkanesulfonate monooxygenase SsuD/methylene tetrahydromethanopterin reductase-like flavin-dependent oxidoreductase (luciferase family)